MTQLFPVAEVMDKEPGIVAIWVTALLIAVLGAAAALIRWWAGLLFCAVAIALSIATLLEILDPFVGPAIRREAGAGYVPQVCVAAAAAIVVPLIASIRKRVKRDNR